ncbi:hypothetical protein PG984_012030 [Apiospora sp. TS-2023a]
MRPASAGIPTQQSLFVDKILRLRTWTIVECGNGGSAMMMFVAEEDEVDEEALADRSYTGAAEN